MHRKTLVTALSTIALGLLIVVGCTVTGGGVVAFFDVDTGNGPGVPSEASVSVALICNDARDQFRSNITLVDQTNGAQINARLPWTPVEEVNQVFNITTCEEAAQAVEQQGGALVLGILNSQGQENGTVNLIVGQPGVDPDNCGDLQPLAVVASEDTPTNLPGGEYSAFGCLEHGKIVFN